MWIKGITIPKDTKANFTVNQTLKNTSYIQLVKVLGFYRTPKVFFKWALHPWASFRVVFTRDSSEAVDVIAKTTIDDFTKCIRRDDSLVGPSNSEPENPNGYLCGYRFFADETVQQSLALARTRAEDKTKFPCPYVGHLYPKNSGHLMWPIITGNMLFKSGKVHGPYYLILDKETQFVDVVVKGYSNNFLRCIRSRKPPKAPESDPHSKLFVQPPKTGFLCGKVFFDDQVLKNYANLVKSQASKETRGKFPQKYSGPPYNEKCLIWPILKDGRLYRKGNKGPYRFILTPEYEVKSVATLFGKKLIACEKRTIKAKKNHDESDYHCKTQSFSHQQLVEAAERACEGFNTASKRFYPASYKGSRFNLEGPYFTYPIRPYNNYRQPKIGQDLVVINRSCEVVGALTTLYTANSEDINDLTEKRLVKCHRLDDGPLPDDFFGENAETVSEHRIFF
ncbi:hypothetical protein EPUL_002454 [Erysiphe pulchra]|uniref:Uncharacterized protein n=1 Tax=Erysiphe pulchra TaxID=225359 RepID=A0A2S4PRS0_9PEZI|nr:hypothetical protein EPUL_002454 [Erysiphe pulchra]